MPFLDVSDVLLDPDFFDMTLLCQRNVQTVDDTGRGVLSSSTTRFAGVVTSDKGELLQRGAPAEHISDFILVITRFRLVDGKKDGTTADIVRWGANDDAQYTVTKVNPYSTYGIGFVEALCELIPLSGS